ncbi:hypothetical protein N7467_004245 [Penicillium canescens]|nr:hypothetical protein N7467_004245 [Penicillium canescens]
MSSGNQPWPLFTQAGRAKLSSDQCALVPARPRATAGAVPGALLNFLVPARRFQVPWFQCHAHARLLEV